MFWLIKNKSQRFEDDADWPSARVRQRDSRRTTGKPKFLGSGGSMVAKLKLKGTDGRAPPGVEPVALFDSTRGSSLGPDTVRIDRLRALS